MPHAPRSSGPRLLLLGALLAVVFFAACSSDEPSGPKPLITWSMSGARFRVMTGEVLSLVPDVENTDETTTYAWSIDGRLVGTADHYEFSSAEEGEFFIRLRVTNRFGEAEDEVKVTVQKARQEAVPQAPADSLLRWEFPFTEINMPVGSDILISPLVVGSEEHIEKHFQATAEGDHRLAFRLSNDSIELEQEVVIHVCPPAGTYRRTQPGELMANRVYEFQPAPGHQVNGYIITGQAFPPGCTEEQACDTVLSHFGRHWMISLGGWGGFLTVGFDHSVPCHAEGYDLCIQGNPYDYQSEPGIVWVSQDVNGDGLPNDLWYELAGSEYGSQNHSTRYAMTYYRPAEPRSGVAWRGCDGETDYIPYMSYWNPAEYYWQDWQRGDERLTFFGSRLRSNVTYSQGVSSMPPYPWGYADNLGSDYTEGPLGHGAYLSIRTARTWDGRPANLEYIDFVRVQSGITGHTPNLGDASTEVYCITAAE